MSYDETNRFAFWPNQNKRPDKQDADFTGTINIDGREYWVNGWKKKPGAKENAPSLSGTVKPKEEMRGTHGRSNEPVNPGQAVEFDDDIPF